MRDFFRCVRNNNGEERGKSCPTCSINLRKREWSEEPANVKEMGKPSAPQSPITIKPAMNEESISTGNADISINNSSEDIPTISFFKNHHEDVDILKANLKQNCVVSCQENSHSEIGTDNCTCSREIDSNNTVISDEMHLSRDTEISLSLPNLTNVDGDVISSSTSSCRKVTRCESSEILCKEKQCPSIGISEFCCPSQHVCDHLGMIDRRTSNGGESTQESADDVTITSDMEYIDQNTYSDSASDCCTSMDSVSNNTDEEGNSCKTKKDKKLSNQSLTLTVNPENSRLSTVLENIPLVYIPHTRQLVNANTGQVVTTGGLCPTTVDELCCNHEGSTGSSSGSTVTGNHTKEYDSDEIEDTISNLNFEPGENGRNSNSPRNTLQRTSTSGSLTRTDASSFSSISSISTGTDFSASVGDEYLEMKGLMEDVDEAGFMEVNLHARNSFERSCYSHNSSQDSGIDEKGVKPKRKGITSFLSRNLFSRKSKDQSSAPGWKLFGKVPPKQTQQKDPITICEEYQIKQQRQCSNSPGRTRKKDVEVLSTTALILENRPMNLPSKSPEEELRHRQEYEAMVEAARKKELKAAKLRKKQLQQQLKVEEQLSQANKVWQNDILPNWDTAKCSKRARDLWWLGIPPSVRGKVWKLAIGNDLNLTEELYDICLSRAKDRLRIRDENNGETEPEELEISKESSVELIQLDVSRTFPQLCIFQKGGPYHDMLHSLLGAYACYRPDVGYVQGMSFIAAVLLLNMELSDAFICFANLLNKPCQVAFFRLDESLMKSYFSTFEDFFQENLPKLHSHFTKQGLTPDLFIIDWMFTLYSKSLPLDVASRVWDVFCRDSEEFLFRTALGILKMYETNLLTLEFIHLAQFLTKLPEAISSETLFKSIETIKMTIDKRKFAQVLSSKRESTSNSGET